MKIYVIVSRDCGVICATTDFNKIDGLIKDQQLHEEMGGGKPSVFYKELNVIN